jgi:hypothetical protein
VSRLHLSVDEVAGSCLPCCVVCCLCVASVRVDVCRLNNMSGRNFTNNTFGLHCAGWARCRISSSRLSLQLLSCGAPRQGLLTVAPLTKEFGTPKWVQVIGVCRKARKCLR